MIAREIIIETLDGVKKHMIIERDDGSFMSFPADPANTDYANIMALVAAGELTIAPAEGG